MIITQGLRELPGMLMRDRTVGMMRRMIFMAFSCLAVLGTFFITAKPQPWYPRLCNLAFPPELARAEIPAGVTIDRLEVLKSERRLVAYANGQPVKVYFVALSKRPVGHKQYEGDRKVPEGAYTIDGKNSGSRYHKNLGVSYPNARDEAAAALLGKPPGGAIKIHGLGPRHAKRGKYHWLKDWSHGCIVVTDAEVDELYAHTPVGTPIEIIP